MIKGLTKRPRSLHSLAPGSTSDIRLLLRPYQRDAFENRTNGIECWLWGRQTGKSFTLAAWAIDRLITRPGRLVTILSNSLSNGMEINQKCAAIAHMYACAFKQTGTRHARFETMNLEIRLTLRDAVSRIKILPANPRTARGFSGDLILDEFAFHENSTAIWEAVEPILASNVDYLCRIASTPNGRQNMFYQLATDPRIPTRRVPRSVAWQQGLIIAHPITREPITPQEARFLSQDKLAYDQNYECEFKNETMTLLSDDLVNRAATATAGLICEGDWSTEAREFLSSSTSPDLSFRRSLYVGVDVGRSHDITVISVFEKISEVLFVRLILRLRNLRLPAQQTLLEVACRSPRFASAHIDMTGLGLGLFEYTQQRFGDRIRGINFSSRLPLMNVRSQADREQGAKLKAASVLALTLLQCYEANCIRHPLDPELRDDLRRPERVTSPTGLVSISATRTKDGHADHFWSFALAAYGAMSAPAPSIYIPKLKNYLTIKRDRFC